MEREALAPCRTAGVTVHRAGLKGTKVSEQWEQGEQMTKMSAGNNLFSCLRDELAPGERF